MSFVWVLIRLFGLVTVHVASPLDLSAKMFVMQLNEQSSRILTVLPVRLAGRYEASGGSANVCRDPSDDKHLPQVVEKVTGQDPIATT